MDEVSFATLKSVIIWTILAIISLIIIIFCPSYYIMIARMFLCYVVMSMADMSTAFPEYSIHEYWLPCLSFWYLMVIIAPNYWKSNCLIFLLWFIYFAICVYLKYGHIPERFKLAWYATLFYFIMASLLLNSKMNQLCSAILKNEKLVEEMKKLLTIFPNGVLIHSGFPYEGQKPILFSNQQFMTQIVGLNKRINQFETIEVSFQENAQREDMISTNLKNLLENHQKKLYKKDIVHQDKIKISCCPEEENSARLLEEDNTVDVNSIKRIYNVKSMKVEWEDQPCYMHVFVDTTDIVKLEEATNNIRWQKLMFASASHEFRTPLNAITNSYSLIGSSFDEIDRDLKHFWHNCI